MYNKNLFDVQQLLERLFGMDHDILVLLNFLFSYGEEAEFSIIHHGNRRHYRVMARHGQVKTIKELVSYARIENPPLLLLVSDEDVPNMIDPSSEDPWTKGIVELAKMMWVDTTNPFNFNELLFKLNRVPSVTQWIISESIEVDCFGQVYHRDDGLEITPLYSMVSVLNEHGLLGLQPVLEPGDRLTGTAGSSLDKPGIIFYRAKTVDDKWVDYHCDRDGNILERKMHP